MAGRGRRATDRTTRAARGVWVGGQRAATGRHRQPVAVGARHARPTEAWGRRYARRPVRRRGERRGGEQGGRRGEASDGGVVALRAVGVPGLHPPGVGRALTQRLALPGGARPAGHMAGRGRRATDHTARAARGVWVGGQRAATGRHRQPVAVGARHARPTEAWGRRNAHRSVRRRGERRGGEQGGRRGEASDGGVVALRAVGVPGLHPPGVGRALTQRLALSCGARPAGRMAGGGDRATDRTAWAARGVRVGGQRAAVGCHRQPVAVGT